MLFAYCLHEAGIGIDDVDAIGFYEKPLVKFERLLETYLSTAPRGLRSYLLAMPLWLGRKLWMADEIQRRARRPRSRSVRRSPRIACRIGVLSVAVRRSRHSDDRRRRRVDDLVDSARSRRRHHDAARDAVPALGWAALLGLYVLHRLHGQRRRIQGDGTGPVRRADLREDNPRSPRRGIRRREHPAQPRELRVRARAEDDGRALRAPLRRPRAGARCAGDAARNGPCPLGAGNCRRHHASHGARGASRDRLEAAVPGRRCRAELRGNGRLLREGPFEDLWIQPAAGDAGGALGVAYALWHRYLGQPRTSAERRGAWVPRQHAAALASSAALRGRDAGARSSVRVFPTTRLRRGSERRASAPNASHPPNLRRGRRAVPCRRQGRRACFRDGWNSVLARSAAGRSSPTPVRR